MLRKVQAVRQGQRDGIVAEDIDGVSDKEIKKRKGPSIFSELTGIPAPSASAAETGESSDAAATLRTLQLLACRPPIS